MLRNKRCNNNAKTAPYFLQKTKTPCTFLCMNEIQLYQAFLSGNPEGLKWFHSESSPLLKAMKKMCSQVMSPRCDNFTPAHRTPWGGDEIFKRYKAQHGIKQHECIGESWEISGHQSFPNKFMVNFEGQNIPVSIKTLEKIAAHAIYGKEFGEMPILVKFLNSGSWQHYKKQLKIPASWNHHKIYEYIKANLTESLQQEMLSKHLSIQVHPKRGQFAKYPAKTEAWIILDAEEGAGIYLGLKEGVKKKTFETSMYLGEDLTPYLNFVPVENGELYHIPAGTLHAISAGILVLEVQESSESTFRAYDWEREYGGERRTLHKEKVMQATNWISDRGEKLIDQLRHKPSKTPSTSELRLECPEFSITELQLKMGDTYQIKQNKEMQAVTVLEGAVQCQTDSEQSLHQQGQSFLIPASLKEAALCGVTTKTCVILANAANLSAK